MVDEAKALRASRSITSSIEGEENAQFCFEATMTLEWIRQQIVAFADERGWRSEVCLLCAESRPFLLLSSCVCS